MKKKLYLVGSILATICLWISSCESGEKQEPNPTQTGEIEITTREVTITGLRSVRSGGNIVSDGGQNLLKRGVCWSTAPEPTVSDKKTVDGSGIGLYTSAVTGLQLNTSYYLRAYVISDADTVYGDEAEFSTNITSEIRLDSNHVKSVQISGTISEELTDIIQYSGICWDTSELPVIAAGKNRPLEPGAFKVLVTELTPNTKYHFRTFMIIPGDTLYSVDVQGITLPEIHIDEPEALGARHLIGYSDFSNENGSQPLLSKGVCFSTASAPTVDDNAIETGTTMEEFVFILRTLTANTTYYLRAFATNEFGTAYSDEISFTTPEDKGITYTMNMSEDPSDDELDAYIRLTESMNSAVEYYDEYTNYNRHVWVNYSPGVPTADANNEGWMRFGSNRSFMNVRTCLHELSHTVGIGTDEVFYTLMVNNKWTGQNGNAALRAISGNPNDQVNQSGVHIWPHGLNFDSEGTAHQDFVNHCLVLEGMRKDGL